MIRPALAAAIVAVVASPAFGHRLDEYLQNTILSVEKHRVHGQMTLTPGVSVFPLLIGDIDADADGVTSEAEARAYAARVLRDTTLRIDGFPLTPQLVSSRFPSVEEMRQGRGEIQLEFSAGVASGGRNRKLSLESRHHSRIAAYQVNSLVSLNPAIRIGTQKRNYSQSLYELEYVETDVPSGPFSFAPLSPGGGLLGTLIILLLARLLIVSRCRFPARASF